ncbi:uncharacterized protein LOC124147557 isoform X2 [Haliotis rufescens]|uniref:uncharacterized protein LOC124147557 isoform X2 n=1 Tax=Haliotis rufescens TaxID=6454 RepID=UPI00201E8E8C|nr:uncharacterized protein LOC124147557 isoform X2 [Haliotis rufescens]
MALRYPQAWEAAAAISPGSMSGDERKGSGTYSVFVGRLHREATKEELYELFKHCGPILTTYIADYVQGSHIYGFVRFADPKAALTAVRELDQWTLKGWILNVELSTDTRKKLVAEGHLEDTHQRRVQSAPPARHLEMTRMSMDNLLSESRLRDCCTEMNRQQGIHASNRLDAERLIADINGLKCGKTSVLHGDLIGQQHRNISHIKRTLMKSEANGRVLPQTTNTFFKTLQNILENVVSIAQEVDDPHGPSSPGSTTADGACSQPGAGNSSTFIQHLTYAIEKTNGVSLSLEEKIACTSNLKKSQSDLKLPCRDRTCDVSSRGGGRNNCGSNRASKLEESMFSDKNDCEGDEIEARDLKQSDATQTQAGVSSGSDAYARNMAINVKKNYSKNDNYKHSFIDTRNGVVGDTRNGLVGDTRNGLVGDTRNGVINDTRNSGVDDTRKSGIDDTRNSGINDTRNGVVDDTRNGLVDDTRNCMVDDARNCMVDDARNRVMRRALGDAAMMGHASEPEPEEQTNCKHCSLRDIMRGSNNEESNSSDNSDSKRYRRFLKHSGFEKGQCVNTDTSSSNQDDSENDSPTSKFKQKSQITATKKVCVEQRKPSELKLSSDSCEKCILKNDISCDELTSMLKNILHIPTNGGNQTKALKDTHVSAFHFDPELNQASYCSLPASHRSPAAFRNSPTPVHNQTNTSGSASPDRFPAGPQVTNGYLPPMGRGLSSILDRLKSKERRTGPFLSENEKPSRHVDGTEHGNRFPVDCPHVDRPHVDCPHVDRPHVDCPHVDCPHVDCPHVFYAGGVFPSNSNDEILTSNCVEFIRDETFHGTVRQRNARPKALPQSWVGSSTHGESLSKAEIRFRPLRDSIRTPPQVRSCEERTQPKPNELSSVLSSRYQSSDKTCGTRLNAQPKMAATSMLEGRIKSASSESDVVAADSGVESDSYQRIVSVRKSQERDSSRSAHGVSMSEGSRRSKDPDQLQLYIKQVVGRGRGLLGRFE